MNEDKRNVIIDKPMVDFFSTKKNSYIFDANKIRVFEVDPDFQFFVKCLVHSQNVEILSEQMISRGVDRLKIIDMFEEITALQKTGFMLSSKLMRSPEFTAEQITNNLTS